MIGYFLLTFGVGLFWLWFFSRKDAAEPEPRGVLIKVFVFGALSGFGAIVARPFFELSNPYTMDEWLFHAFDAFLVTSLSEELLKSIALLGILYNHPDFDEPVDGMIYGVAIALGFASLENYLYLERTEQPLLAVQRSFTSSLAHVSFTGIFGYFVARAKFADKSHQALGLIFLGFLTAFVLHGAYDLFLILGTTALFALLVILPMGLGLLSLKLHWLRRSKDLLFSGGATSKQ